MPDRSLSFVHLSLSDLLKWKASLFAEVVIAPTFVHIPSVKAAISNSISVAAQNCWVKGSGAYTGEIRSFLHLPLAIS